MNIRKSHEMTPFSAPHKVEMAQKVTVVLEDDLTGGTGEQTIRFAFERTGYEIDLNAKNAAAFSKQLAPYIAHARRAGRPQPRRPGGLQPAATARVTSGPGRTSTACAQRGFAQERGGPGSAFGTGPAPAAIRRAPERQPAASPAAAHSWWW